jgi:hypothetical protein
MLGGGGRGRIQARATRSTVAAEGFAAASRGAMAGRRRAVTRTRTVRAAARIGR